MLITRIGTTDDVSRLSRLRTMKSAANSPKMAPDAPAGRGRRREHIRGHAAAQTGHEVEGEEADRPEHALEAAAEHPQRPHVHEQVQRSIVEKHLSDEAVVLTVGDAGRADEGDVAVLVPVRVQALDGAPLQSME